MFEGLGENRTAVRLDGLRTRKALFAPVEAAQRSFADCVADLAEVLGKSALGRALLTAAEKRGVSVGLDPLLEASSSFFYPVRNRIDLGYQPELLRKTEKGLSRYLVSFTGALRRAWHHHAGAGADFSLFPEAFLEQFRLAEADAEAVVHQVAWELRAQGAGFLWRYLLSVQNGDIAVVFEREAAQNMKNSFDGRALRSAFDQWFAESGRIAAADHFALEMLDMALVQAARPRRFASRALKSDEMQSIGRLPTSQNYLAGCLFTNPWYRKSVCDINRTHLRHIEQDVNNIMNNQGHSNNI